MKELLTESIEFIRKYTELHTNTHKKKTNKYAYK